MPSGNKPATQTQKQERSPWAPAVPNLEMGLTNARTLSGDVSNFTPTYSGSTQAGIAGLEGAAPNLTGARDALGNVVPGSTQGFNVGLGQMSNVASGAMLGANPYLDDVIAQSREGVTNAVNGQFAGAGRYGSAAHTGALTKGLGQMEMNARMGNYSTERAAQDNAARGLYGGGFQGAAMGGALDQSQLTPYQVMLQAGALRDAQSEAERTAPLRATEWLNSQSLPIAGAGGSSTGTTTTTQPTNRMGQILGGVQMGLGLLSGNPMMMASGTGGLLGGGGSPISMDTSYALQNQWAQNPGGALPWR
jgi:hypothetical protein